MTARRCTGAVIAGGRGTRMGGRAKGLERVGPDRMIDRVATALREAADDLVLVANDTGASRWLGDTRVVADIYEDAGALGVFTPRCQRSIPTFSSSPGTHRSFRVRC